MNSIAYFLEVYDADRSRRLSLESVSPFMAIAAGDVLDTGWWDWGEEPEGGRPFLRVVQVDHVIWEVGEQISHKIILFAEVTEDPWGDSERKQKGQELLRKLAEVEKKPAAGKGNDD